LFYVNLVAISADFCHARTVCLSGRLRFGWCLARCNSAIETQQFSTNGGKLLCQPVKNFPEHVAKRTKGTTDAGHQLMSRAPCILVLIRSGWPGSLRVAAVSSDFACRSGFTGVGRPELSSVIHSYVHTTTIVDSDGESFTFSVTNSRGDTGEEKDHPLASGRGLSRHFAFAYPG
jgi:hypothetical protein